jgi:hypothetical protein
MSLPGFTAETSLDKTKEHYRRAVSPAHTNGGVYPEWCGLIQGWRQEERYIDCIMRCRSAGGTVSGCKSACCRQLTGSSCCYIA